MVFHLSKSDVSCSFWDRLGATALFTATTVTVFRSRERTNEKGKRAEKTITF